ncbi:cache domain-containing sensor histidine kinase [Cohnella herbarum]|uniref:histidine kinase n=1 Tax=Cohnella herbarum TaxID=2728023 RepID=A0A7Z2ZKM1_9BACL|nr:sensor histidine kinase [Cohnella herbarum]QJD82252.1 sensor histidine kinase [Cohnella herbarum]
MPRQLTFPLRRRWKISTILIASFVIMISLPITLIATYTVNSFETILLNNATSRAMQTLEQISYTVDSKLRLMKNTMATIANDREMITAASSVHFSKAKQEQLELSRKLESNLHSYFHYTPDVISVMFAFEGKGMDSYKQNLAIDETKMRNQQWFRDVLLNKNKVHIMGTETNTAMFPDDEQFISVAVAPNYSKAFFKVEMIYFVFNASEITELLETKVSDAGDTFVLNASGSVLASSNAEAMRSGLIGNPHFRQAIEDRSGHYVENIDGRQSFVVYRSSSQGFKYIQVYSYSDMVEQINAMYKRILAISAAGLIVFLLVSYLLVRSIVKPIGSLVNQMAAVKSGNLKAKIKESGPVETYVLGVTFNEMVSQLKASIQEIEDKETQKRLAEIASLQSQINPHFLLNTLNTIKLMASLSNAGNIQKMTEALTKLLSSAFNRGGMYTTLEDEIKLLDYYVQIMKIRYGDQFDIRYEIDPHTRSNRILKLLLQPIVENAIIHGLHEREVRGLIQVEGTTIRNVCQIVVRDNGRGMSPEVMQRLLAANEPNDQESFNGIGLKNVHDRLRLNYGPAFGITIESEQNKGTIVTVVLPYLREDDEHAESIDR